LTPNNLDQKVQGASELVKQGMALDAANGFAGGAPASANAQAALGNIGQTNVSTLQAFQGSRVLAFGDRNFNCMGDEVFCTDPATGKTVWKFKLEGDLKKLGGFLAAPPVAAGDQVFLGTLRGEVLQIDPASGKVVKTYQTGSPIRCQPVVDGGKIYVGTQDGRLVCVDTGNQEFTGWSMWGGNAARTGIQEAIQ
jgi:outer membrane protein assembly factor BamB